MILDETTLRELQSLGIKSWRYPKETIEHPTDPELIAKVLANEKKREKRGQFQPNYDPRRRWAKR
jgi:hypothetical protein